MLWAGWVSLPESETQLASRSVRGAFRAQTHGPSKMRSRHSSRLDAPWLWPRLSWQHYLLSSQLAEEMHACIHPVRNVRLTNRPLSFKSLLRAHVVAVVKRIEPLSLRIVDWGLLETLGDAQPTLFYRGVGSEQENVERGGGH
jgi:hypothetical protein